MLLVATRACPWLAVLPDQTLNVPFHHQMELFPYIWLLRSEAISGKSKKGMQQVRVSECRLAIGRIGLIVIIETTRDHGLASFYYVLESG